MITDILRPRASEITHSRPLPEFSADSIFGKAYSALSSNFRHQFPAADSFEKRLERKKKVDASKEDEIEVDIDDDADDDIGVNGGSVRCGTADDGNYSSGSDDEGE